MGRCEFPAIDPAAGVGLSVAPDLEEVGSAARERLAQANGEGRPPLPNGQRLRGGKGLPMIERGIANADFNTPVSYVLFELIALEDEDDLGFTGSRLFHGLKISRSSN